MNSLWRETAFSFLFSPSHLPLCFWEALCVTAPDPWQGREILIAKPPGSVLPHRRALAHHPVVTLWPLFCSLLQTPGSLWSTYWQWMSIKLVSVSSGSACFSLHTREGTHPDFQKTNVRLRVSHHNNNVRDHFSQRNRLCHLPRLFPSIPSFHT